MRWIDATPDSVTYVRESDAESVLVHLVRSPCASRTFVAHEVGAVEFGDCDLVEVHRTSGDAPTTLVLPGEPGAYVLSSRL